MSTIGAGAEDLRRSPALQADAGPPLLVHRASGVATLTLNRPSRRNALNSDLLHALGDVIDEIAGDDSVRAVIVTGAGESFCSGADTAEMAGGPDQGPHKPGPGGAEALRRGFKAAHRVILGLHRMEKPVIAAVDGAAVGAGLDLACACDMRIATTRARFMAAYVRVGLFPGYGGTWFYPRLLGPAKAAELMFTGDYMEADEAHRLGFVNRLVEPEKLMDEARSMAARIAAGPTIAIRLAKTMMYSGLQADLEAALKSAAAAESITLSSQDHLEGMAAMRERRRPEFKGV